MEEMMVQLSSLGVIGIVGGVLFKKFLDDDKIKSQERKEEAQYYREEIKAMRDDAQKDRDMYREELEKDRRIYVESIEKVTGRIDKIENDIEYIKEKIE